MNEAEIRTRLSELRAKQDAAPGWGAAVGARQEEIKELEGRLSSLTVSLPVTGSCRRCSDCEGEEHHWMPDCDEETGDPMMVCKHCEATREMTDDDFDL